MSSAYIHNLQSFPVLSSLPASVLEIVAPFTNAVAFDQFVGATSLCVHKYLNVSWFSPDGISWSVTDVECSWDHVVFPFVPNVTSGIVLSNIYGPNLCHFSPSISTSVPFAILTLFASSATCFTNK